MDRADGNRWLWGFIVGVVALWAVSAAAETTNHGTVCFQLLPFEDRLKVDVVQRDPSIGGFDLPAEWIGQIFPAPPSYDLQGSGNALESFDGTIYTLSIPIYNNTSFFMSQPIGRFTGILQAASVTGSWHADFVGGNGSPFVVRGTLRLVDCNGPNPPVNSVRSLQAETGPRLAGQ